MESARPEPPPGLRPLGPGLTLTRCAGATARRSFDATLVLGTRTEEPVRLEGAATLVWDLLAGPTTVRDLLSDLSRHFSVPESTIQADLSIPLERLMIVGAVEVV